MKIREIRQQTDKELQESQVSLKEKLRETRFNLINGKVKNIREIHRIKKNIAQILTIIKERQQNGRKK